MKKDAFAEKLIKKASEIFKHFGYKKTTMDEIARQLGKGKSSIYYYFSCKEDIFQAVVEKEALLLKNEVKQSIEGANEPIEKFKNYVTTRIKVYRKVNNFYNALKNDGLLHLDFVDSLRKKYETNEIKLLESIFAEGVNKGDFNLKDTKLAALAIVTALKGLEEAFYSKDQDNFLESQLDSLLNILFYGIMAR